MGLIKRDVLIGFLILILIRFDVGWDGIVGKVVTWRAVPLHQGPDSYERDYD